MASQFGRNKSYSISKSIQLARWLAYILTATLSNFFLIDKDEPTRPIQRALINNRITYIYIQVLSSILGSTNKLFNQIYKNIYRSKYGLISFETNY